MPVADSVSPVMAFRAFSMGILRMDPTRCQRDLAARTLLATQALHLNRRRSQGMHAHRQHISFACFVESIEYRFRLTCKQTYGDNAVSALPDPLGDAPVKTATTIRHLSASAAPESQTADMQPPRLAFGSLDSPLA